MVITEVNNYSNTSSADTSVGYQYDGLCNMKEVTVYMMFILWLRMARNFWKIYQVGRQTGR